MLFPYLAGPAQRAQAFERLSRETPDLLVHRWAQYQSDVPSLSPEEIAKIEAMAAQIVARFATPFPVRAVLLQGHADTPSRRLPTPRSFRARQSRTRAVLAARPADQLPAADSATGRRAAPFGSAPPGSRRPLEVRSRMDCYRRAAGPCERRRGAA
jgi:hypothetical protein